MCPQLPVGLTIDEVRSAGYDLLQLGMHPLAASIEAQLTLWREVMETGTPQAYLDRHQLSIGKTPATPAALAIMEFLGLDDWLDIEREYTVGLETRHP